MSAARNHARDFDRGEAFAEAVHAAAQLHGPTLMSSEERSALADAAITAAVAHVSTWTRARTVVQ